MFINFGKFFYFCYTPKVLIDGIVSVVLSFWTSTSLLFRQNVDHVLQVEEEEYLIGELKKIELRKKEREKKQQDLQKLITAADSNADNRKADRKSSKKKIQAKELKIKDGGAVCIYML